MGAETSVQRDGSRQDDAPAEVLSAEVNANQEESSVVDTKPLQKNGQISSVSSLNGLSDDNTLAEVGQPDSVPVVQKEEAPETMDTIKEEVAPQANGEKTEKESPDANDIIVEENAAEEKQDEANEVGFKKIFRFVGFKFTLKKDKNKEKDPVKLLTVKDKEGDEAVVEGATEKVEEEVAEETPSSEEKAVETKDTTPVDNGTEDTDKTEATEVTAEGVESDAVGENAKEEGAEKESESSPPSQEVPQSSFRKLLTGGLFSNLRKKASVKKTKEEEEKEMTAEEEITEADKTAETAKGEGEEGEVLQEPKAELPVTEEQTPETTPTAEAVTPALEAENTEQPKTAEEKTDGHTEEDNSTIEVTTEAELLSSQEKVKPQGSPLKKLFTGAGLKKLSTKKQKSKKDAEAKPTESGEQAAEQLQSSTESEAAQKPENGISSPEESGEHAIEAEAIQAESSPEAEGEVHSDGEKKKDGIIPWSSFKKLVTPKKRVKKSSESDEEATGEKPPKSATLSSTESAVFAEKLDEEEAKEDNPTEEEPKTENAEKLVSSTEESKKRMDTSVSWEALMCMGGAKKRTRRTSDSDDEETKLEEEASPAVGDEEQVAKAEEPPAITSTEAETEDEVAPAPEPTASQQEKESAWDTLKRVVFSKTKPKSEEKTEDTPEQVPSDGEVQKEESMFSLRKLFPGRRKKKVEKQASNEMATAEEDSDTPAVVPLSEYDTEQTEGKKDESLEAVVTQTKVSAEDRSPSWIPAIVDDGDEKVDQLSDIPEEADNAATPKSADTTIAEDDADDQSPMLPKTLDQGHTTPVVPTPTDETIPVSKSENKEMVVTAAVETISEISVQTFATVEDVPVEDASAETEYEPAIEHAESQTKSVLELHNKEEATIICTVLETKEIATVALEEPVTSTVESLTVISDALCTEVAVEEMPAIIEEAVATEDIVLEAKVQQVETAELEAAAENVTSETITEIEESETEKIACDPDHSEITQPTEIDETEVESANPITSTVETTVSTESVEITEPAVEMKEKEVELEQLVAVEEIAPVQEIVQAVTQENITIESTTETVILDTATCVMPEQVEIKNEEMIEEASIVESVVDETVQAVVETSIEAADLKISNLSEQESEETADTKNGVEQAAIEEHSMVIARAVIENAMDKVLEDQSQPPKPATLTEQIPSPVEALTTTEEDVELDIEKPVISDTPVPVMCEEPATTANATQSPKLLHTAIQVVDNLLVEETENLDGPIEEVAVELKQAVEVNASEENVVIEEVAKLKSDSQTGEDPEEVKKEQEEVVMQEVQPAMVKEPVDSSEEVKQEPTVAESETSSEQKEEQMPDQVVLQTAVEDTAPEEEAEVDDLKPSTDTNVEPDSPKPVAASLPTLLEEPQTPDSTEEVAASQDVPASDSTAEAEKAAAADKCAVVMAQVIEVIEEAVKEIEPISSEITAAS